MRLLKAATGLVLGAVIGVALVFILPVYLWEKDVWGWQVFFRVWE